ncbi:hypothetical protein [Actinobacillus vicugnae]|uniref:hypothetical protein n=1 Tax=Actinobacillus vicugnae TaxID=2573093 RepID=UPI001241C19A|nr:hypothetical protein [Actinobacillus vicugnae]
MKKILFTSALISSLSACAQVEQPIGGEKDEHGCLSAAGFSYSVLKQECVQPFDIADIRLADHKNDSLAIYVILSEDKSQAELFSASLPKGTILDVVKGGYISKDNQIRLIKQPKDWKIYL